MGQLIIDTHAHLWLKQDTVWNGKSISPLPNGRSMFMGEERQMCPPFMIDGTNTAEVFLSNMDYAQVAAAVVVQEYIDGVQNEYYAKVNAKHGERLLCCYMPDFLNGDFKLPTASERPIPAASELPIPTASEHPVLAASERPVLGVSTAEYHPFRAVAIPGHRLWKGDKRLQLNSPEFMQMFKQMEERGMILDLCLEDSEQVAEFREVVQECPELKVAIGHFGMPTEPSFRDQISLALNKNVMVESGGITWLYNSEFYPFPSAVRAIKEAADLVGMEKLMYGSDYPRTITAITYKMSYDFILKTNELTDKEKRMFLGENAANFYGFSNLTIPRHVKNMSE